MSSPMPSNVIGCEATLVDLATDADVVVSTVPAILLGIYVDTVFSAHQVVLKSGTTVKINLQASLAAGTKIDFGGIRFTTNLTVESNDAATGKVVILWKAL